MASPSAVIRCCILSLYFSNIIVLVKHCNVCRAFNTVLLVGFSLEFYLRQPLSGALRLVLSSTYDDS